MRRSWIDISSRSASSEALRGLIDAIVLTPEGGALRIEFQGNLAAMLKAAQAQSTGAPLGLLDVGKMRGRLATTTSCR